MPEKWGVGQARLVRPASRTSSESVVFLSDLHVPYQDQAVVDSALRLVKKLKPDRVVVNGDVNDFFGLSRFNTGSARLTTLQDEIDEGVAFRRDLRKVAPDAVIDETEGNHDSRIKTYMLNNAPALGSLTALRPESLFGYRQYEINGHPGAGFLLRRDFLVKHGTLVRQEAGATAKAEYTAAGISGISGHTHRLATYRRAGYTPRFWVEGGCMCRLDPDYIVGAPNWTQGIVVGEFSTKTSAYHVQEVPFIDGVLKYGRDKF